MLRQSFDGVVLNQRSTRRFLEVSESFCKMTGYPRDELIGRTSVELGLVDPNGTHATSVRRADSGLEGLYETKLFCKDGEERWVEFSHQLLEGDLVLTIARDVTARRGLEEDLRRMAHTDSLTGVYTRRRFEEKVERALRESRKSGDTVTLLLVDLDHFKCVNDEHGHHVGDEVLRAVASTLKGVVSDTDFIGRLGGDEFAVLLVGPEPGAAQRVVDDFTSALDALSVCRVAISASVGIAAATQPGDDFERLRRTADRAMYADKRRKGVAAAPRKRTQATAAGTE